MYHNLNTWEVECNRKVVSGRKVVGDNRSLVNGMGFQLECARVLHETLLVYIRMYGSETMIWKEKERSIIRAVQMDKLKGLLGIRRMDKIENER